MRKVRVDFGRFDDIRMTRWKQKIPDAISEWEPFITADFLSDGLQNK